MQKADVTRLVKEKLGTTLAIGDGANDVNMILEAHVVRAASMLTHSPVQCSCGYLYRLSDCPIQRF